MIFSTESVA